jgi:carbamoyl-phosphate synthase large subunit
MNILVTGCGGDIGYCIGKILKKNNITCYGCDITDFHPGKYIYNKHFIVPRANNSEYFSKIEDIVKSNNINLIIPTTEIEIDLFYKKKFKLCKVILCNEQSYNIFCDKLKTNIFLKENNLPCVNTVELNNYGNNFNYPFILKKKNGCGSKNLFIIYDENDFNFYKSKISNIERNDYIIQEYLNGEEYTCCIYKNNDKYHKISFKRTLENGFTKKGTVVNNTEINKLLDSLSEKLDINGSINVQLRLVNNTPYLFEVNPRISSTVYFRYLFNFNDLIWSIEDTLNIKILDNVKYDDLKIINKNFIHQPEHFVL